MSAIGLMHASYWVAGFIVLAEALNKLERTNPCAPGLSWRVRLIDGMKALAWGLLALGAGGAVVWPALEIHLVNTDGLAAYMHESPSLAEVCVICGFAVLVVRTRLKEVNCMELVLQRTHDNGRATFGKLFVDGRFICYTLEDVVREQMGTPVADWKIRGETAIPSTTYAGTSYRVTLETSARFGADTLTIHSVPGFDAIRMHAGNTEQDTEGCVLLGAAIDGRGICAGTSRPAVALVRELVHQAIASDIRVSLTIRNPVELA